MMGNVCLFCYGIYNTSCYSTVYTANHALLIQFSTLFSSHNRATY